jgi:hypothetical protein
MYSFIFDQTYINLFILVIIVSIVMFLWRKLIILEGNFFVLEKRVNLIKKDAREDSISRNIEKSDIIMNEIFKDFCPMNACKQSACFSSTGGDASGTCDANSCDPLSNSQKNKPYNISLDENMVQFVSSKPSKQLDDGDGGDGDDGSYGSDDSDIISFANGGNLSINALVDQEDAEDAQDAIDIDKMVDTIISSSEKYENKVHGEPNYIDAVAVAGAGAGDTDAYASEQNDNDNMSISSEITFTSDDKKNDKTLMKKYSKMSLDKLKEVCTTLNINSDGTRNQLITRIMEVKK